MNENKSSIGTYLRNVMDLGKGKLKLGSLRKRRRGHEQQKLEAVAALGAHAWQLQVQGESFGAVSGQLAELERQQDILRARVEELGASRVERLAEKKRLGEHHGKRVAEAEAQHKACQEELRASTALRKKWEKAAKRLRSQRTSAKKALASDQDRLRKAESEPGATAQVENLRQRISGTETTLAELTHKLQETTDGIPQRLAEEAQRQEETTQKKKRLDAERAERARVLGPVEESLQKLGESLATDEKQQSELTARKADALGQLGTQVNAVRPASEALAEDYQRIDAQDAALERADLEISALEREIATAKPGARRVLYGTLAAAVLAATVVGYFAFRNYRFSLPGASLEQDLAVRVSDASGESVFGASTVLFFEGGPVAQYTDIHGAATLVLDESRRRRGRLVVEAKGFRIHEQEVRLESSLHEIRLEPPAPELADVIVRSLDSSTRKPVAGAEILLLANGDTFSQVTDSHGISKFTLAFYDAKADAQVSVDFKGYEIEHQRVTLLPDRVQDVNLDREAAELAIAPFDIQEALLRNFRNVEDHLLEPGTRATGALRSGATVRYAFPGRFNTPVLFTVQRTDGDLYYDVLFHDEKDFEVGEFGTYSDARTKWLAFTPRADGEHRLHLRGDRYGGSYAVTMAYLSGPPEMRNKTRTLSPEKSEKGMLAAGSFDNFEFQGAHNVPVLIKIQSVSGYLYYGVTIYDSEGKSLVEHGRFSDDQTHQFPFTPAEDGTYRVSVWGSRYYGRYTLALSRLGGKQRNQVRVLEPGQSHNGELAVGAYDDYGFQGHANTPLLLTLQRSSGSLYYNLEIFDGQDRRLAEHGQYSSGIQQIPFTPKADGQYRLRAFGSRHFGRYVVSIKQLSGPPEERNRVRPLDPGGSYTGTIGAQAYDEYGIQSSAGSALTLTLQRHSGPLRYWVEIFDAEGNELGEHGWFSSGIQRIDLAPPTESTLRVRVTANESFGRYVIGLNER